MKIQTFSILAGSEACNARCPFCISKMTPPEGVTLKEPEVNWRNFEKAALLAKQCGCTTAMLTGKGEPTLFPDQITKYLAHLKDFQFPFIEIQTNGIRIAEGHVTDQHLNDWYDLGLNTIAVSIVHYEPEKNRQIYLPYKKEYTSLPGLINQLHDHKFTVRLTAILADQFIDSVEGLEKLIQFAKENKVEQLSLSPVNRPENSRNEGVYSWAGKHFLKEDQEANIQDYLKREGKQLMRLVHNAKVYDVHGQNVCFRNCLTLEPESEEIRQLIFFPDGHLRYDWQYEGAILL